MLYRLQDALDPAHLQELLQNFQIATGVPLSIFDHDGHLIIETSDCAQCPGRTSPDESAECAQCRRHLAASCINHQEAVFSTCASGLQGCAVAVNAGGVHQASIVASPFAAGKSEVDPSGLRIKRQKSAAPVISQHRLVQMLTLLRSTLELLLSANEARSATAEKRQIDGSDTAQTELSQAEEFRLLADHSTDAIVRMSTMGKCLYISPACHRLFGYQSHELMGKNLLKYVHKDDTQSFTRSGILQRLAQKEPASFSFRFRKHDGSYLWVEATGQAIVGDNGEITETNASIRDISERKLAEEALISSEKRFRGLFETMTEGVSLHDMIYEDAGRAVDYIVTAVNPAFATHTGLTSGKAEGTKASVLYGTSEPPYIDIYERTVSTGKPHSFETFFTPLGKHFHISVFSQEKGRFACVFEDITERKLAEENLSNAKEYAEELINAANTMVLVMDNANRVVECNHTLEETTGYTKPELLGKTWYQVLVPSDRYPGVHREIEGRAAGDVPKYYECPIITKTGAEKTIVWNSSPLHVNGQRTGAVSFGLDMSDRLKIEADLQAYQERLGMLMKNLDAVLFHLDPGGVYTLMEGRGLEKISRSAKDYLGRAITEVHKNDIELLAAYRQAAAGKRAAVEIGINGVHFEEVYAPTIGIDGKQNGVIGLAIDITERKRAEQNLYAEKERLKITLQSIGDGVITTDSAGAVMLMNGVAEELTGWSSREALGMPFTDVFDIYNEQTGVKCLNPVERVLTTGNIVGLANHTSLRSRSGAVRSISDSAAPILDAARQILGVILVFRDVTEAKKKESEITYLSYHDRLTGLYNRAFLEEETRRLDTVRQLPISVIMGDVNGLKLTNDVFGHAEGDNLLIRIAAILRDCCRNEDIVARVGGDEFCILLPKTSYATASDICRRIYARCEKVDYNLPGSGAKLSISLGFATKTNTQDSISAITKAAEDSMYRRKLLESRSQHSFLISSIRTTLFEKSFETEQHAQRLISNSKAIAMALNLPEDQINDIELFALLHDIGKIAIDSHILTKTSKLNEEEWTEMRRHPEIGFRIAQASPDLAHIAEYILCHHERWDGTGYPQGLKGTAIPLLARILLVVDAYDAMTQDRIYRKAMSKEDACSELLGHAGTQFDPNIVWVFMEWLEHDFYLA